MMQLCLFSGRFPHNNNSLRYKIGVLDIDGTLTDDNHRKKFLPKFKTDDPKDFKEYQTACRGDKPNAEFQKFLVEKNYDFFIIASGRESEYMLTTMKQILYPEIIDKIIWIGMRGSNDKSKNVEIKNHTIDSAIRCILKTQPYAWFDIDVFEDMKDVLSEVFCYTKNISSFKKFLVNNNGTVKGL